MNVKIWDTKKQTELVYNSYQDNLDSILHSNIDDIMASTINTNSCTLKQITSDTQSRMFFDILLPLSLFYKTISNGDKNSILSAEKNILSMLQPSIMLKKPFNPLFRISNVYGKLKKKKPRAATYISGPKRLRLYHGPIWTLRRFFYK